MRRARANMTYSLKTKILTNKMMHTQQVKDVTSTQGAQLVLKMEILYFMYYHQAVKR